MLLGAGRGGGSGKMAWSMCRFVERLVVIVLEEEGVVLARARAALGRGTGNGTGKSGVPSGGIRPVGRWRVGGSSCDEAVLCNLRMAVT